MANEQITANQWISAWIEQSSPPLSLQSKWENWWGMIAAYRGGSKRRERRVVLQGGETDPTDREFYQRLAQNFTQPSLPGQPVALIPLIGIELDGFSIYDFTSGLVIFKLRPGTWQYIENKRYRDLYGELCALEPRHFLLVPSEAERGDYDKVVQRARCVNLAALLLKDGAVADPRKAIITWITEGGRNRLSGPFFRMYNWGFSDHSRSKYVLRTDVSAIDEGSEDQRPEDGRLHSVEFSHLALNRFEGHPVVIASGEVPLFLQLFCVGEYLHINDVLCDAELFLIRSFLALHDVWYDSAYKQSLVFTCFEGAIGLLTRQGRSGVLDHLRWLQNRCEQADDTDAPAMLDELIALRRAVAHGSHPGESLDEPAYRWAIRHVRSMLRLCLETKAAHYAQDEDNSLRQKNYLRLFRKLRP